MRPLTAFFFLIKAANSVITHLQTSSALRTSPETAETFRAQNWIAALSRTWSLDTFQQDIEGDSLNYKIPHLSNLDPRHKYVHT